MEEHLSLAEAAERIGISERTARRWIKSGKLRAYKPGRDYWIPESALTELVEESEVHPKLQSPLSEAEQRAARQHEGLVALHESAARLGHNIAGSFANFRHADLERLAIFHELNASLAKMRGPRDIWGRDPEDLAEAADRLEAAVDLVETALQEHLDLVPQETRPALDKLLNELLKDRAGA